MSITTHEKIRVESGFQHRFTRMAFLNSPDGSSVDFYVNTDDSTPIVPEFNTGSTTAGINDVQVFIGLSSVVGASQMTVSAVDVGLGKITLADTPDSGSSLVVSFASSPISSQDIETVRIRAESIVNQRLSLCYDLPLSPVPSAVEGLATRLASAFLLMRDYGVGSRSTSKDGYALYEQLMGRNEQNYSDTGAGILRVGEIGLLCTNGYQIVDDNGAIIARNDEDNITTGQVYSSGGRQTGRVFDITEENWRFKKPQADANSEQPGTPYSAPYKQQG